MIKDGVGGASTLTGLKFEKKVDFLTLIRRMEGYRVQKSDCAFVQMCIWMEYL